MGSEVKYSEDDWRQSTGFPGENRDDVGNPHGFASNAQLADHFARHGEHFIDAETYQRMANNFIRGIPHSDVLQLRRTNGDYVRYNPNTGEFCIARSDGCIRSYYNISGNSNPFEYFLRQFR